MKSLYIETNHGFILMSDARIEERPRTWGDCKGTYPVAIGTVDSSVETSHLFHASSSRPMFPEGSLQEYVIWRQPYRISEADDAWRVSTVTCG